MSSGQTGESKMLSERPVKRGGKRPGRKPSKIDVKAKLERSRQSARECRARKKLRYQYLEELVLNREQAIFSLRDELEVFKQWCIQVDKGIVTDKLLKTVQGDSTAPNPSSSQATASSSYPRSRQTSTVTSSSQSLHRTTSAQNLNNLGSFTTANRSRSFEQQPSHLEGASAMYPGSSMSSQLHGSGVQVHDVSLPYAHDLHMSRPTMQMSRPDVGQAGPQLMGAGPTSLYPSQGHYNMSGMQTNMADYHSPVVTTSSGSYMDLSNMSVPRNIPEDPVTTLSAIVNPASVLPSYDLAVSYNLAQAQASTSQQVVPTETQSWYSLLAELDPGLARQGAESASGTPQSMDGIRTLPTVVQDFADTDSGSDT